MKYLLDADTISFFARHNPGVLKNLAKVGPDDIAISTVTRMELEFGLQLAPQYRARLDARFQILFEQATLLEYTLEDARFTAILRAQQKRLGLSIGPYDFMVAGTSLARDLIVVSNNMDEYQNVTGLRLENWVTKL